MGNRISRKYWGFLIIAQLPAFAHGFLKLFREGISSFIFSVLISLWVIGQILKKMLISLPCFIISYGQIVGNL